MAKATNTPQFVVLHHTAVSYDKNPRQFDATNNYHKSQGFPKSTKGFYVGYTAMVEKDGSIVTARRDDESGAHTKEDGMNFKSVALCFTGNFDIEEPTIEQCKAALQWVTAKQAAFNIPDERVFPHRHWAPKTCWGGKLPGDTPGSAIKYLRDRVGVAEQTPDTWAIPAFTAAAKYGFSAENPKEIVATARMRHMLNKEHPVNVVSPGEPVIKIQDSPVVYQEWITAKWKGGAFN